MGFRIRRTDNKTLVNSLCDRIFGPDLRHDRPNNVYWIVLNDYDTPVGFAILTPCGFGEAFLSRSGILPPARGKNLQTRLIKVRETYAKKAGIKHLVTYAMRDNGASIKSLLKCGFNIYRPDWEWAGKEMVYFVKELEPISRLPRKL